MDIGERRVRPVWSTEGIGRLPFQFLIYCKQIVFWKHYIGVEHYDVFSFCPFCSIVAALSRSAVLLIIIMYVELVAEAGTFFLAWLGTAILYYDDLEILQGLAGKALKQFFYLVRSVVNRYYYRIFHCCMSMPKGG